MIDRRWMVIQWYKFSSPVSLGSQPIPWHRAHLEYCRPVRNEIGELICMFGFLFLLSEVTTTAQAKFKITVWCWKLKGSLTQTEWTFTTDWICTNLFSFYSWHTRDTLVREVEWVKQKYQWLILHYLGQKSIKFRKLEKEKKTFLKKQCWISVRVYTLGTISIQNPEMMCKFIHQVLMHHEILQLLVIHSSLFSPAHPILTHHIFTSHVHLSKDAISTKRCIKLYMFLHVSLLLQICNNESHTFIVVVSSDSCKTIWWCTSLPGSPGSPSGPLSPGEPWMPGLPWIPCMPWAPGGPGSPGSPWGSTMTFRNEWKIQTNWMFRRQTHL